MLFDVKSLSIRDLKSWPRWKSHIKMNCWDQAACWDKTEMNNLETEMDNLQCNWEYLAKKNFLELWSMSEVKKVISKSTKIKPSIFFVHLSIYNNLYTNFYSHIHISMDNCSSAIQLHILVLFNKVYNWKSPTPWSLWYFWTHHLQFK